MKPVSKAMYMVGKIINIIELIFSLLVLVGGVLMIVFKNEIAERGWMNEFSSLDSPSEVGHFGIVLIISALVIFTVSLVIYIFAAKASKSLNEGDDDMAAHTTMLIVGIF